jgi:hypothetical protein
MLEKHHNEFYGFNPGAQFHFISVQITRIDLTWALGNGVNKSELHSRGNYEQPKFEASLLPRSSQYFIFQPATPPLPKVKTKIHKTAILPFVLNRWGTWSLTLKE